MNRRTFVRSTAGGTAALAVGRGLVRAQQAGERTRNVLEGVEQIGFGKTACLCYPGSVEAVMRYLGEPVTTEYVMGVSGGAFVILWGMPWCNANCDITAKPKSHRVLEQECELTRRFTVINAL